MDGNGGGRDVGDCSGVLVLVVVTVHGSTVCGFASGVSCAQGHRIHLGRSLLGGLRGRLQGRRARDREQTGQHVELHDVDEDECWCARRHVDDAVRACNSLKHYGGGGLW